MAKNNFTCLRVNKATYKLFKIACCNHSKRYSDVINDLMKLYIKIDNINPHALDGKVVKLEDIQVNLPEIDISRFFY